MNREQLCAEQLCACGAGRAEEATLRLLRILRQAPVRVATAAPLRSPRMLDSPLVELRYGGGCGCLQAGDHRQQAGDHQATAHPYPH